MSTLPPSPTIPRPKLIAPTESPRDSTSQGEPFEKSRTQEFIQCYQHLRAIFQDPSGFTNVTILKSVTQVIHIVEVTTTLPGHKKKSLVLEIMHTLILDNTTAGSPDRQCALVLLETVVPSSIDLLISVATGELEIGKITPQIIQSGCCGGAGAPQ